MKYPLRSHIKPCARVIWLCILGLVVSSCSSELDTQSTDINALRASYLTVSQALYFDRRTPDGFYQDAITSDAYYSVSHIKNTSLVAPASKTGMVEYELSSSDFVEALSWSDTAAVYQATHQQLAGNSETSFYYQFSRFNPAEPDKVNYHRVFKSSILDRSGVDRSNEDATYQGKIMPAALTVDNVKLLIEYLWTFSPRNNYSNAVFESYTTETSSQYTHHMKQATLAISDGAGCDRVDIYQITYIVPKLTGEIQKAVVLEDSFLTKRTGSLVTLCQ